MKSPQSKARSNQGIALLPTCGPSCAFSSASGAWQATPWAPHDECSSKALMGMAVAGETQAVRGQALLGCRSSALMVTIRFLV